jgi:HAE1 family hydrophobic/amphiphilic exporter-1
MNLPESAVRRSVTVYMLIFGLLLLGGISLSRLSLDLLPDIKLPAAVIMTEYPGAGPSEIEKMVTEPLEGVLSTLSNLDKVQSQCMPGSSVIVLFFDWGTDMDFATLEVREKLDLVRSFLPSGVKDPMIFKLDPSLLPVIQAGMSIGGSGAGSTSHGTTDPAAVGTEDFGDHAGAGVAVSADAADLAVAGGSTGGTGTTGTTSAGTQAATTSIPTTDPAVAAATSTGSTGSIAASKTKSTNIQAAGSTSSTTLADLTHSAAEIVKPRLERLPGVAWVVIGGGVSSEVHVLMDPAKMEAHGLSIDYVAQILMGENLGITAGTIKHGEKELRITTKGEFEDLEQIANTPIVTPKGSLVYLKDISQVKQSFGDITQKTSMNGVPSVGISIFKQTGANTVQVAEAVHQEFESLKKELPENTQINTVFDQSEFIKLSIDSVKSNALIGAFLAILIIFLFLRNVRTTLVIAISIPISIITTFIMMYFAGFTLNMLSLGGLALGVGMIVDDSIVVLESIFRYREAGCSAWESATAGAQEVAMAVTASTFTNVVVFLPVIFIEGIASQIFKELALTVSFALLASLLVALTLVPVLANRLVEATTSLDEKTLYGRIMTAWGRALDALDSGYRSLLEWSMNHRKQVLLTVLGIFIFSIALYPLLDREFLPDIEGGEVNIAIEMPTGTGLEETAEIAEQVEKLCEKIPEVDTIFTTVGSSGVMSIVQSSDPDKASIQARLLPRKERQRSSAEVARELRQEVAELPGAKIEVAEADPKSMGMEMESPVSISIQGDEMDVLEETAEEIAHIVSKVPGTGNVKTSLEEGKPEIQVQLDRERAATYGLGTYQVAQALKSAISGQIATRYRSGGQEVDLRVRLVPEARTSLEDLENLRISSPLGIQVPLKEIAQLKKAHTPAVISRQNQTRSCSIYADLDGRSLGSVMDDIRAELDKMQLPPGYSITYGGEQEQMLESFDALKLALILGIILIYMVMASQFESLFHPLVIMFTIPMALIGVILAFVITGMTFSIAAYIGVILLAGLAVKNGIVLVDYINVLRSRGLSRWEAILQAGPIRLRPVLMTALTAIFAMLPLALGLGEGAEIDAPLALAVIGGLTVATFLTLVVVPLMYTLLEDIGMRIGVIK